MHLHVALSPAEFAGLDLSGRAAVVVDVMRATTTVIAACAAGCRRVIPVPDAAAAWAQLGAGGRPPGEVLLAGERGGDPIVGFDLGNSPLEYTAERVRGRTLVLTTTNGTAAILAARGAAAVAVAALTNVEAVARWALGQGRDATVLCAGEQGAFSLEDAVCAGILVERITAEVGRAGGTVEVSDAAVAAWRLSAHYAGRLGALLEDATWARTLARAGRSEDLWACLALSTVDEVPVFEDGAIVPGVVMGRGAGLP
ncbi:MAG: 2-phosphosulfolactate phosphatase [Candidatus Rokubacteria bacterium]|nr:2-phosphosulfolactate phosphatase [Candidatus Rokubacteria bacterium]